MTKRNPSDRKSGRKTGQAVEVTPHFSFALDATNRHALAVAHLDLTEHAPLDYPSIQPTMPTDVTDDSDIAQLLFCKLFHLNSYRKDLIKRDASGANVNTPYADATNEADECLAKLQALANNVLVVTVFPSQPEIQTLATAMIQMETAITGSAQLTTVINFADSVIRTIPARGVR